MSVRCARSVDGSSFLLLFLRFAGVDGCKPGNSRDGWTFFRLSRATTPASSWAIRRHVLAFCHAAGGLARSGLMDLGFGQVLQ